MKIIKCLFLVFCSLNSFSVAAQKSGGDGIPRGAYPTDTLDYAELYIHYRQLERKDTTKPDKFTSSEMILQIGKKMSNYTNWIQVQSDSIRNWEFEHTDRGTLDIIQRAVARTRNSGDYQTIFKNYPKGKYLVQSRVFFDKYLYEEPIPAFGWKLESGESEWLGYTCRKATCTFRGRDYTAWYTSAIPINNGPWKFNGLPGLILRVEDSSGDCAFDATAIYRVNWKRPIYIYRKPDEFKTTREKFLRAEKNGFANPTAAIQGTGKVTNMPAITKKFPYNPIELE